MAEPLYCELCGAEDYDCGHVLGSCDIVEPSDHGPDAYCEIGRCRLWRGERCECCADEGTSI